VNVRAGILYEYHRSPDTFGIGLSEVPVAGWEAIPFSFVADWFFNIGSYIEAITPISGVKRLGSWTTTRIELSTTRSTWWNDAGTHANGQSRVITADGTVTEKYVTVSKNRRPGISVGLATKVSPLSGDIGKKRILDLVALGTQVLKS